MQVPHANFDPNTGANGTHLRHQFSAFGRQLFLHITSLKTTSLRTTNVNRLDLDILPLLNTISNLVTGAAEFMQG